jgi:hypothetical protein
MLGFFAPLTVNIAGGSPVLSLSNGGSATYDANASNPSSGTLVFDYTVRANETASAIAGHIDLNGATITDQFGRPVDLSLGAGATVQIGPASVQPHILAANGRSELKTGQTVQLILGTGQATVDTAGGSPTLALNDGGTATYDAAASQPGFSLVFDYTVAAGDHTAALAIAGVSLNGATIRDSNGVNLNFASFAQPVYPQFYPSPAASNIPVAVNVPVMTGESISSTASTVSAGQTVKLTVDVTEGVTVNIAGGSPTLTLSDGATATYDAGSSTPSSGILVFDYTVGASDASSNLQVTSVNLNGATIRNSNGQNATFLTTALFSFNLKVNAPLVTSVAPSQTGPLAAGQSISITLTVSTGVTVNTTAGVPSLTLDDGAVATYDATASRPSAGTLVFDYTIGSSDYSPDLTVAGVNLNGATIEGSNGVTADFSAATRSLGAQIGTNTTPPLTVIETKGVTELAQSGNDYVMLPVAGGPSVLLQYQGSAVTVGQFGAWMPVGAEAVSAGYEVAWKNGAADQYRAWKTDSSGNYQSTLFDMVNGTDPALEALETTLQQDLNGDGTIGPPSSPLTVIETKGATELARSGDDYVMLPVAGGPSVLLQYQGSAVTVGQLGSWAPIGAEKTATGYEVAWKNGNLDQYAVWLTDNSGNLLSNPTGVVSGESFTLQSYETSFQQDLNGDGTTGVKTTVIEAFGATKLVHEADRLALLDSSNNGPTLMFQGAPVTDGEFGGGWTAIGAEKTATGYEVAWKNGNLDQYAVWLTDNNGNMLNCPTGVVSGESFTLQSYETSFQQDLNSDGTTGVKTTVIEAFGATSLVHEVDRFAMLDSSNNGPMLMFQGTPVIDGEFGAGWTAIGAEKTATGYEVAWKNGSLDQYAVWLTDNNGNMLNCPTGVVSGESFTLQSYETSFQQDLNSDGTTGVKTTVVEAFGATSLVHEVDRFAMLDSSNNGPTLMFQGAPVTDGEFGGGWTAIGAEKTATGYEVAWKNGSLDQYAVWLADNNGNMLNCPTGVVSGESFTLQSCETSFQQDLNGDGIIGEPVAVSIAPLSADKAEGDSGTTPFTFLVTFSEPLTSAQSLSWTVAGAGFDPALPSDFAGGSMPSGTVTFAAGETSQIVTVFAAGDAGPEPDETFSVTLSTTSSALTLVDPVAYGTLRSIDNGLSTVIEMNGATELAQSGNDYVMLPAAGGTPVTLQYQGAAVTVGEFGAWTPIGAEAVSGGYDVAWKLGSADQYTAWKTDANGNYQSSLLGVVGATDPALEALETTFKQDLNGDGTIGPTPAAASNDAPSGASSLAAFTNAMASSIVPPAIDSAAGSATPLPSPVGQDDLTKPGA